MNTRDVAQDVLGQPIRIFSCRLNRCVPQWPIPPLPVLGLDVVFSSARLRANYRKASMRYGRAGVLNRVRASTQNCFAT